MRASSCVMLLLALETLTPEVSFGGTYSGTVICNTTTGCNPDTPVSGLPGEIINPGGITYPISFLPAGTTSPNVRFCVEDAFGGKLSQAVQWAVGKWNALVPAVNNCVRCLPEEVLDPFGGDYNLASTVLHEIGHCFVPLTHTTLIIDTDDPGTALEFTSYTISYNGTSAFNGLLPGADMVRGSKDDTQLAPGGSRATVVHWFRLDDNNPIIIDSTPIDGSEYSRDRFQFPTGSTYVANANVGVSNLLGNSQTNTVMATSRVSTSAYFDLTADDVNMVKMSRTGLNRVIGPAGGMNDDHAIQIDIVPCASAHDIKISTAALPSGISGSCSRAIDYVFPADPHTTAQDYKIVSAALVLTNLPGWEFNIPMFYGSFETGTYDAGWVVSP